MKMNDIDQALSESITEAPVGMLRHASQAIASKFSSKAAGSLETTKTANSLYKDFNRYLGKAGINTPTAKDVKQFLKHKSLSVDTIVDTPDDVELDAKNVGQIFLKAVQKHNMLPTEKPPKVRPKGPHANHNASPTDHIDRARKAAGLDKGGKPRRTVRPA